MKSLENNKMTSTYLIARSIKSQCFATDIFKKQNISEAFKDLYVPSKYLILPYLEIMTILNSVLILIIYFSKLLFHKQVSTYNIQYQLANLTKYKNAYRLYVFLHSLLPLLDIIFLTLFAFIHAVLFLSFYFIQYSIVYIYQRFINYYRIL